MNSQSKLLLILFYLLSLHVSAQDVALAANAFLNVLDSKQKEKAQYILDDAERFNWHFVPRERNGVCFRTFTAEQRSLGLALLKSSIGEPGFEKANAIMELENVLREIEGRSPDDKHRDPLNYYITIFGNPSKDKAWGWRFEGHHIALNFSSEKNALVSSTPSFFGSNPGIVPIGPEKGKQILKLETELGLELANSLTPEQKLKAVFAEKALPDIISFNKRKASSLEPFGLRYSEMTATQQKLLSQLLDVYVKNYQLGFAKTLMNKIKKAGIENLTFAWAGGFAHGAGLYYRIQGPMLLIEYDNTQNNTNHVHAAVRDLTNDFAEDILKEHYQKEHN